MAATLPSVPPVQLIAGDSCAWRDATAGYAAADGWTAAAYLTGPASATFSASADGALWIFALALNTSAALPAGLYRVQVRFSHTTEGTFTAAAYSVTVAANPVSLTGNAGQSADERSLVLARAAYDRLLSNPLEEYNLGGTSGKRRKIEELTKEMARLERRIARARNGGAFPMLGVSFSGRR